LNGFSASPVRSRGTRFRYARRVRAGALRLSDAEFDAAFARMRAQAVRYYADPRRVMLTRYKGPLKLKHWALAIAKRSTMRKARIALARRLAIIMHAMLRHGTEFKPA
jgi:uncharacterized protein involved in type VI secretion and phage assembly